MSDADSLSTRTDCQSKMVVLRAERHDTIHIYGLGDVNVVRRTRPYFGPKLLLHDEQRDQNWQLTAPGPYSDPQLWQPRTGDEGRVGWEKFETVTARIESVDQYRMCECGEPIKTLEHERKAAMGVAEWRHRR